MTFYLNRQEVAEVTPGGPFDEPMYMFLDTEVFTWEGLPTLESLNNENKNAMTVEWVRGWRLVDLEGAASVMPEDAAVDAEEMETEEMEAEGTETEDADAETTETEDADADATETDETETEDTATDETETEETDDE